MLETILNTFSFGAHFINP